MSDLPAAVGNAVGAADPDLVGGLILSSAIICMVGLALSATRTNTLSTAIVLLLVAGLLTAIGWLGAWFLVIAVVTIVALFGVRIAQGLSPG